MQIISVQNYRWERASPPDPDPYFIGKTHTQTCPQTHTHTHPLPILKHSQSVQLLSHVQLFETPWTSALQASLSNTNSWSLLKLMSIMLVMPSDHFILCHPLLLPSSVLASIRVFSSESVLRIRWPKYWSFNFSISPSNEYSGLISFMVDR